MWKRQYHKGVLSSSGWLVDMWHFLECAEQVLLYAEVLVDHLCFGSLQGA